jgi:hypothetical protein
LFYSCSNPSLILIRQGGTSVCLRKEAIVNNRGRCCCLENGPLSASFFPQQSSSLTPYVWGQGHSYAVFLKEYPERAANNSTICFSKNVQGERCPDRCSFLTTAPCHCKLSKDKEITSDFCGAV